MATIYCEQGAVLGDGTEANPYGALVEVTLAAPADGDTVLIAGVFRGESLVLDGHTDLQVARWAGRELDIRADTVLPPIDWAEDGDGTYLAAVADAPASAVCDWDTSIDAQGHNFGHLIAATSEAACIATPSSWHWSGGQLRVHPAAGDPAPTDGGVYAWCRNGNATRFANQTGLRVSGLRVTLWCGNSPANGLGIYVNGTRIRAIDCHVRDGGWHGLTNQGGICDDVWFCGCTVRGGRSGGTHCVLYGSSGDVRGGWSACEVRNYTLLGRDGQPIEVGGSNAMFSHGNAGLNQVTDLQARGCRVIGFDDVYEGAGGAYISVNDTAAATAAWGEAGRLDPDSYPVRVVGCHFTGHTLTHQTAFDCCYERCRFDRWAAMDVNNARFRILAGQVVLFLACEIVTTLETSGSRVFSIGGELHLIANSIMTTDAEPSFTRTIVRRDVATARAEARGNVFAHHAARGVHFGRDPVENLIFKNNVYVGVDAVRGYGQPGVFQHINRASFEANVDPAGEYHDATLATADPLGLVSATTSTRPAVGGSLEANKRLVETPPRRGVGGRAYDGTRGAYQFGSKP